MKTQIDIGSALVGIIVGVLAVLAVGAGTSFKRSCPYQVSSGAGYSIMFDTKTGQAWGSVFAPSSGSSIHNDGNFFNAK